MLNHLKLLILSDAYLYMWMSLSDLNKFSTSTMTWIEMATNEGNPSNLRGVHGLTS